MSDGIEARAEGESIAAFGRRRAAALGLTKKASVSEPELAWDDDLLPKLEPGERVASSERVDIDSIVKPISILDAYAKWCRKMIPNAKGRSESIMVSCPNPTHPDTNPSAWMSLNKGDGGVGNCAVCGGFDKYDIAAWSYGYAVPEYRRAHFVEVVRRMAEDMGYRVMIQGKDEWAERIGAVTAPLPEIIPATVPPTDDYEPLARIATAPMADWRTLPTLQPGTFLYEWMLVTSDSYEPEEFYLWLGLALLGVSVGNEVLLKDNPDVRANLLVCLVGSTGTGKSIAIRVAEGLLRKTFPWDSAAGTGVKLIGSPGSGEALVDTFNHSVDDPTGSGTKTFIPVKGLYRENELSTFIKKASRTGSTIREVIMDMFDSSFAVGIMSRGAGTVTARDHFLSVVSSTQPDALGGLLSHQDAASGFLNRWVFAYGKSKYRPARATYRPDTDPLVAILRNIRAWGGRGRTVDWFDAAAGKAFDEFYEKRIRHLVEDEENEQPLVARLPLLAKKLVLLFAINAKRTTVTVEDVSSVEMIWEYILDSYGLVATRVSMNDEADCSERIKAYMRARPGQEFTARQLTKQSGARKYTTQAGLIQKVVNILIGIGEIEEVPRPRDLKKGAVKYRYVADDTAHAGATIIAFPAGGA